MRLLLIGAGGQVGSELRRTLGALGEVAACDFPSVDLGDQESIRAAVHAARPDAIVNAAAYTAVDRAESEPELAMRVNGAGPGVLAQEAQRRGALLVHYSTDYVFDGAKPTPYSENDAANPLNAYGRSKLEGERRIVASGCRHLILRTSWVYGPSGKNFLLTILRLAGERRELRVVNDQVGAPTFCRALAELTATILPRAFADASVQGVYHATNSGETSWFGFAEEILRLAKLDVQVQPVTSRQYPTPAERPANSRLDNGKLRTAFGQALPEWRIGLVECMRDLGPEAGIRR